MAKPFPVSLVYFILS